MNVLGIHDGHSASACLLVDGKLQSAIQEERMVNRKNMPGMPVNAIREILRNHRDVDEVALATNFIHEPSWFRKKGESRFRKQDLWEKNRTDRIINKFSWPLRRNFDPYFRNRLKERLDLLQGILFPELFPSMDQCPPITVVDHHTAHAATAYYGSHYDKEDSVLVLTADGSGDGVSSTVSKGYAGEMERLSETTRGGSVGELYSLTTHYLGFRAWEHEYKLMGMAPYSYPDRYIVDQLHQAIQVDNKARFVSNINTDYAYGWLAKLYKRKRFDRICASLQAWFEEIMANWVIAASDMMPIAETPVKLACAGGTFMNVKGNQVISEREEVRDMFIFPSAGDESTSVGAAMHVYAKDCLEHGENPKEKIEPISNLYLGPMDQSSFFLDYKPPEGIEIQEHSSRDVTEIVAESLARGEIVARCSGRCEFGARALGNRSIMAKASDHDITDLLNASIKHRDFWMPFAPSILEEDQGKLIENPKCLKAKWMIQAFNTTEEGYRQLKAATHPYDKTARPQTVDKSNGDYYKILEMFKEKSGFSGLLNTSFNLHGFPIVKDAEIAMDTFLGSGLKKMVVGNYVITKVH